MTNESKKHNHKECTCGRAQDKVCRCECDECALEAVAMPSGCGGCEGCDCQK